MRSRVVLTMAGLLVRCGWFDEVVLTYTMPGHGKLQVAFVVSV